jgi:hypothetical protein
MIPRPQTGTMKKLNQVAFQGNNWQLITDNQALKSVLKAIGVKDDDYRCAYILTGFGDNTIAAINHRCLEVWAGWHQVPRSGSVFVCLYNIKSYTQQGYNS